MYSFPKITIPKKAIEHAKSLKIEPDMFFCVELLEKTGVCVLPGSAFHQRPDTYHLRITILPPVEQVKSLLSIFEKFYREFLQQWS